MPGSILFRDKLDPETAIFSDVQEVPRYIYIYTYPDIYIYIPLYIYIYPETAIFSDVQEVGPPSPLQTRISSERLDRFRSSSVLSLGWGCCEYWCFRWGGAAANISALVGVGLLRILVHSVKHGDAATLGPARDIFNGLPEHGCLEHPCFSIRAQFNSPYSAKQSMLSRRRRRRRPIWHTSSSPLPQIATGGGGVATVYHHVAWIAT